MIKRLLLLLVLFCIMMVAWSQNPAAQSVTAEKVADGVYIVRGGSGANCGFVVGDKQVLAVDAKMSRESVQQMLAEIRKVTPNPVAILALTHSDGDHVNGIHGYPENLAVVAQRQTLLHMDKAFSDAVMRRYLPQIAFEKEFVQNLEPFQVRLLYFGPAHTDGDAVVYIPERKVAFVGDLIFFGRDPLIHLKKNGRSAGLIQVWKEILKLDVDLFISGHSDPCGREEAEAFVRRIEEKRNQIVDLVKAGKTLEEVKQTLGEENQATEGARRWPTFTETIFQELSEKRN